LDAHLLRGLQYAGQKQYDKALVHFRRASEYPENLSLERPESDRRGPQIAYHTAAAYAALGQTEQAGKFYNQSASQEIPSGWSESRFYQAMAMRELGQKEKADSIFKDLVAAGTRRLSGEENVDFFAKFGEQQTRQAQRAAAHYELGLGLLGQGRTEEAKNQFEQALKFNAAHTWARYHLSSLKAFDLPRAQP
jgi:tetratricopeptide (TPR) repeat protein